jgi:hypothetical protein
LRFAVQLLRLRSEVLLHWAREHKIRLLLKMHESPMQRLRKRAIAEYHELLAADETLTPATFEKLRSAMRKNRLLYGDRPIGIALRPHFLDQEQFRALTLAA